MGGTCAATSCRPPPVCRSGNHSGRNNHVCRGRSMGQERERNDALTRLRLPLHIAARRGRQWWDRGERRRCACGPSTAGAACAHTAGGSECMSRRCCPHAKQHCQSSIVKAAVNNGLWRRLSVQHACSTLVHAVLLAAAPYPLPARLDTGAPSSRKGTLTERLGALLARPASLCPLRSSARPLPASPAT